MEYRNAADAALAANRASFNQHRVPGVDTEGKTESGGKMQPVRRRRADKTVTVNVTSGQNLHSEHRARLQEMHRRRQELIAIIHTGESHFSVNPSSESAEALHASRQALHDIELDIVRGAEGVRAIADMTAAMKDILGSDMPEDEAPVKDDPPKSPKRAATVVEMRRSMRQKGILS